MLLAAFIREGIAALEPLYPAAEARSLVLMLCQERLGTQSYTHIIEPGFEIPAAMVAPLGRDMERLIAGEPVQYVLGYADFCGYRFRVTPDVLIPRPETEGLVQLALERLGGSVVAGSGEPLRVLDLCTGSGCIAWSVALGAPGVQVVGVDLSPAALSVARGQDFQAQRQGAAPVFVQADVLDTEQDFPYGPFDLVLSNPPYILEREKAHMRRNVLEHEPALALFVPDADPLLFYRAVARWSRRFLRPGGMGLVEINEDLGPQTLEVFRLAGMSETVLLRDFLNKNRYIFYRKQAS